MKSTSSLPLLSFLLALAALPLGACLAPPVDSNDEHVGEAEDELSPWVVDTQISGQFSQRAPALATYNYDAFMVHGGGSDNSLWWSTYDSTKWSTNQKIANQTSKETVGLTQHGPLLHMAYLCGQSTSLCHSTYPNGNPWTAPVTLSYTSNLPPALASDPITNKLMLVYVSSGGSLKYTLNDGDWHPSDYVIANGKLQPTTKAPTLAVHQGRIHMVYELSGGLVLHTTFNGLSWELPNVVQTGLRNNPSLASYAGKLYLFHRGTNDNKIWWMSSPEGTNWTANVSVPTALTGDSPAIAQSGVVLMLAHRGNSGTSLWYSTYTW